MTYTFTFKITFKNGHESFVEWCGSMDGADKVGLAGNWPAEFPPSEEVETCEMM